MGRAGVRRGKDGDWLRLLRFMMRQERLAVTWQTPYSDPDEWLWCVWRMEQEGARRGRKKAVASVFGLEAYEHTMSIWWAQRFVAPLASSQGV